MRVSVIVVSYNTRDHLRRCLISLAAQNVHEVIVVDNASIDGSVELVRDEFPWVRLFQTDRNLGFGAANNIGLDEMTGDLAFFLNSDCIAEPGSVAELASVFQDSKVVAAGGQLYNEKGVQNSCCNPLTLWAVFCEQSLLEKAFPNSNRFSPYWVTQRLLAKSLEPVRVAQVMGACLMVRPCERFDESFFLYCEDTELCHRLAKRGDILYAPRARFHHALGASSADRRAWSIGMYNRGKELYFLKTQGPQAMLNCLELNRLGALWRMVLAALTLNKVRTRMFWKVLTTPLNGPALPEDALIRPT